MPARLKRALHPAAGALGVGLPLRNTLGTVGPMLLGRLVLGTILAYTGLMLLTMRPEHKADPKRGINALRDREWRGKTPPGVPA